MSTILAADIGGTKTHFVITDNTGKNVLYNRVYLSSDYATFSQLLHTVLHTSGVAGKQVEIFSLAIAGDVETTTVKVTNLPWRINRQALMEEFKLRQVYVMNDFQASAWGIPCLEDTDKICLHKGKELASGTRVVLGAGTGMGLAWVQQLAGNREVFSTEAGHIDFAPVNALQVKLLQYLMVCYQHVSCERLLSGAGLETIYQFLSEKHTDVSALQNKAQTETVASAKPGDFNAAWVTSQAVAGNETACRAVRLFTEIYGAYIGNMALIFKPAGGIYITGGIAAKIQPWMQLQEFISAFKAKGRMQNLVEAISITLVTNESVGVLGAISAATEFYQEKV